MFNTNFELPFVFVSFPQMLTFDIIEICLILTSVKISRNTEI